MKLEVRFRSNLELYLIPRFYINNYTNSKIKLHQYVVTKEHKIGFMKNKTELEIAIKDYPNPIFHRVKSHEEAMKKLGSDMKKQLAIIMRNANIPLPKTFLRQ